MRIEHISYRFKQNALLPAYSSTEDLFVRCSTKRFSAHLIPPLRCSHFCSNLPKAYFSARRPMLVQLTITYSSKSWNNSRNAFFVCRISFHQIMEAFIPQEFAQSFLEFHMSGHIINTRENVFESFTLVMQNTSHQFFYKFFCHYGSHCVLYRLYSGLTSFFV